MSQHKWLAGNIRERDLSGQVAIVTGAGRGIGREIAMVLAQEGIRVAINDVRRDWCEAATDDVSRQPNRHAISCPGDVAKWGDVQNMVDHVLEAYGTIDILVNNAGLLRATSPLEQISQEEWKLVMDVNLKGAFYCTKAALPIMKRARSGRIVNVASIAGRSVSNTGGAHYTTSKAALLGFTRHAAREAAPYNINVNAIAPAGVDTMMVSEVSPPEVLAAVQERIPMRRLATTQEIANLVLFLVAGQSSFVTGATIHINGGLLMI